MTDELTPARVRPAIRRIAKWVLPVLLLIAAWQIWDAIEARRLEPALAGVIGPPIPMEIRAGGTDEGAGKYYSAAAMLAVSVGGERVQPVPGGPIVDSATAIRDALARGNTPAKEALDAAAKQIDDGRAVFDLLTRASALPFLGFAPGTEFNYRFSGLLDVHRLAALETMNLILNADADRAARVLLDRLRSLRALGEERSFMQTVRASQVREIATDLGILAGRLTVATELLSDLDRSISEIYPTDAVERAIRSDVLWMHGEIRSMWEGRSLRFVMGPLLRPLLRHHAVARLRVAADAFAAARKPWPDRIRAMNAIPDRRSIVPEVVPFIAAWRVAALVREQTVSLAEGVAATRCARLAIAIERDRRARNRLPESLTDVVPDGDERLIDPFTGKPLIYARSESGYVVYSVASNERDEGGTFAPDLTQRPPGPRRQRDVGVRVVFSPTRRTP